MELTIYLVNYCKNFHRGLVCLFVLLLFTEISRRVVTRCQVESPNAARAYGTGEIIVINVVFNQEILLDGTPTLVLETGVFNQEVTRILYGNTKTYTRSFKIICRWFTGTRGLGKNARLWEGAVQTHPLVRSYCLRVYTVYFNRASKRYVLLVSRGRLTPPPLPAPHPLVGSLNSASSSVNYVNKLQQELSPLVRAVRHDLSTLLNVSVELSNHIFEDRVE